MITTHGSLWNVFIYVKVHTTNMVKIAHKPVLLWFISDQHKYLELSCRFLNIVATFFGYIAYFLENPFWMFFTVSLSNSLNSFCLQALQQKFAVIMYSIGNCYIFTEGPSRHSRQYSSSCKIIELKCSSHKTLKLSLHCGRGDYFRTNVSRIGWQQWETQPMKSKLNQMFHRPTNILIRC